MGPTDGIGTFFLEPRIMNQEAIQQNQEAMQPRQSIVKRVTPHLLCLRNARAFRLLPTAMPSVSFGFVFIQCEFSITTVK